MRTFPLGSIHFFVLDIILRWGGLFCMILTVHFTIFRRYYYRHNVKVDAIYFCNISGALTDLCLKI